MREYYLMIVADVKIDRDTKFYRVGVGTSKADVRCFQKLSFWAKSKGFFFRKIDSQVDDFYLRIAKSMDMQVYQLPRLTINVTDLWRHVRSCDSTPSVPPLSYSAGFARRILVPREAFDRQINVIRKAESGRRNKPKVISDRINPAVRHD